MMGSDEGLSRPSIGFPLGIVLLILLLFCITGFFTCCYHWDNFRALLRSFIDNTTDAEADTHPPSPPISKPPFMKSKQNQAQSFTVLMPGDQVPKFVAMPCPCEPTRMEKIVIEVQKEPPLLALQY